MIQCDLDQFTIVWKNESSFESLGFEDYCQYFISHITSEMKMIDYLGVPQRSGGRNGYDRVFTLGENTWIGYNSNRDDMGICFYFSSRGLESYIGSYNANEEEDLTRYKVIQNICSVVNDRYITLDGDIIEFNGYWSLSRCDIAIDFIDELSSEEFDSFSKKVNENEIELRKISYKGNEVSSRTQEIKLILTKAGVQTLYIGQRTSPVFVRFYDKKKQLEDVGQTFEEASKIETYFRFEVEIKMKGKEERAEILNQICLLDSSDSFVSWCIQVATDKYRFYESGKLCRISELMLSNLDKNNLKAVLKQTKMLEYEYEKSKYYYKEGDSGLQGLFYKIRMIEGEEKFLEFVQELVKFQREEYIPSEKVKIYLNGKEKK